jgi:hypothetical protein
MVAQVSIGVLLLVIIRSLGEYFRLQYLHGDALVPLRARYLGYINHTSGRKGMTACGTLATWQDADGLPVSVEKRSYGGHHRNDRVWLQTSAALANGQQVVKSFRYHLTDPRRFDIMQSGPGWRGSNATRSIETPRVHCADLAAGDGGKDGSLPGGVSNDRRRCRRESRRGAESEGQRTTGDAGHLIVLHSGSLR